MKPIYLISRSITCLCFLTAVLTNPLVVFAASADDSNVTRPNILFAISDDQSYPHASAYGCSFVDTPSFDRVARRGVLFHNAFAPTPGCSPTRASLLTGYHAWQIEHAGTHASAFPSKFAVFPDLLENSGYFVGYTGKGWGPGNFRISGRTRNPAGNAFNRHRLQPAAGGISNNDYTANFSEFLEQRPEDRPFCFWFGASEPHRGFDAGVGIREGKKLADVDVPRFLPDTEKVRSDLLDYAVEIEWFDHHLGQMLDLLESTGELDRTLVIVTSDNGMAFPRAKANLYEFGIHMPLAVMWPNRIPGEQSSEQLVGFVDLTATILDACEVQHPGQPMPLPGRSLLPSIAETESSSEEAPRQFVYSARERHSSSRYRSLGYPQRSCRSDRYLYIINFHPERWPAGAPQKYGRGGYPTAAEVRDRILGPDHGGYHDIDACPTLSLLVNGRDDEGIRPFLEAAVGHRPSAELYDVIEDPACMNNLALDPDYADIAATHRAQLTQYLRETKDPRLVGNGDVFETYPRYSRIRIFPPPKWAADSTTLPDQPWWDERVREMESKDR